MEQFTKHYAQLNPLQRKAVDHIEQGPLLLIAGPGTGKTQVLSLRIANILRQTDARPENILALTFTDAAAKTMRERLLTIIGKDAYYLNIATFHAFCRQVIADHGEYFPLQQDSEHISDIARYQLFEQLIDELEPEYLRPINDPYLYVNDISKAISDLKREGISVLQFEEILRFEAQALEEFKATSKSKTKIAAAEKQLAKQKNVLVLYQTYQERLRAGKHFDYDDMINFVVEGFTQHEDLLREYQENLHYFLVDEYQDTNSAQNKLVHLLAGYWEERGGGADLFAVGDPNQAVYRFQGASVENVLDFTRSYPDATVITLETGYRCPQNVYDLSTALIAHNQLTKHSGVDERIQLNIALKSPKGVGSALQLFAAPSSMIEAVTIAETIAKLKQDGVSLREIAVLYRNHADVAELEQALLKWAIPYQVRQRESILDDVLMKQLLLLLEVLAAVQNNHRIVDLYQLFSLAWLQLDQLVVLKLGRVSGKLRQPLYDVIAIGLEHINEQLGDQAISEADFMPVLEVYQRLQHFAIVEQQLSFHDFFTQVISEQGFGFLPYIQSLPNKFEHIERLNALFAEIKMMVAQDHRLHLLAFLRTIQTYQERGMKIAYEPLVLNAEAVTLSTVHSAKGMEWERVFVMRLVDKKWGNKAVKQKLKLPVGIIKNTDLANKERNEDDRRLLFVALTRAKEQLYLSYPVRLGEAGGTSEQFPSIFLTEMHEAEQEQGVTFLEVQTHQAIIDQTEQYAARLLKPTIAQPITTAEQRAYLETVVADFALSPTALDSYLRNPQDFLTNNLLRLPRAMEGYQAFGTAVHAALEQFYGLQRQQASLPSLTSLLTSFEVALQKQVLVENDYKQRLAKGQEFLTAFYAARLQEPVTIFDVERSFSNKRRIFLGDIQLTGKIDRIDLIDEAKGLLRVVDYKTGRPKSRNDIQGIGKTASSKLSERERALPESIRGSYKRQLVFYKLLLDLDTSLDSRLQVAEAVFEFVQPRESGAFAREAFSITDDEVNDLKALIQEVMTEIRALKFLEV